MAIKLTKNELKVQKDRLKQYQRYLPTLQLKKQQLQSVIMKKKAELEQMEQQRLQMIGDLDLLILSSLKKSDSITEHSSSRMPRSTSTR